jgi:acyl carrier protein
MSTLTRQEAEQILLATIRKVGEENIEALEQKVASQAQTGFRKEVTAPAATEEPEQAEQSAEGGAESLSAKELVQRLDDEFQDRIRAASNDAEKELAKQAHATFKEIIGGIY